MANKTFLTASIVYYKNDLVFLKKTINSFLAIDCRKRLFLINNTTSAIPLEELRHHEIECINSGKNLGFGKGHNSILSEISQMSTHHLILNPDVWFESKVISKLIAVINDNPNTALIAPKIVYPNGDHQYSCRRYPSFFELIIRRIHLLKVIFRKTYNKGIYADLDISKPLCLDLSSN